MTSNANGYFGVQEFYNDATTPDARPTAQNPIIAPPLDPQIAFSDQVTGGEAVASIETADLLALKPRVNAIGSWAFGGAVQTGDQVDLKITNGVLPGGLVQVSTLAVAGDTLASIAIRLRNLINANPTLVQYGLQSTYAAPGAVPTLTLNWPGPVGNLTTLGHTILLNQETASVAGAIQAGDLVTLKLASAGLPLNSAAITIGGVHFTGDVVSVLFSHPALANGQHTTSYTVLVGDNTNTLIATGLQAALAADAALAPLGMTSNADQAQVFLNFTAVGQVGVMTTVTRAATETLAIASVAGTPPSALAPSPLGTQTITIGGTITADDLITVTLSSPNMSPVRLSYTVLVADTATTIATALAALINANAQMIAGGVTATSLVAVVTVSAPANLGLMTITGQASHTPTETETFVEATGSVAVSRTVLVADTATTIATALKNSIANNAILKAAGVQATSALGVVSINYDPSQGAYTFTKTLSGGATLTLTLADNSGAGLETLAETQPTGGSGPVVPLKTFMFSDSLWPGGKLDSNGATKYLYAGQPYPDFDQHALETMVAQGLPIS